LKDNTGTLPPEAKSIPLRDVVTVRRGDDIDPTSGTKQLKGTATLRRNCADADLAISFSLILTTR
jgi:hypothetical protein